MFAQLQNVQTLLRVFHLVQFIKCWGIFLELNSKGLYQSSEKAKEGRCSRPPKTREIRQFHVVVAQRRQGNAQKRVMDVQGCCFANLNLLGFFAVLVVVAVALITRQSTFKEMSVMFSYCLLI